MKPIQMFSHWEQVRADLLETIDKFSEGELSFVPFKGSWSAGKIMLHIADCENHWFYRVVRHETEPWTSFDLTDHPNKPDIKALLEQSWKRTVAFLENIDEDNLDKLYTTPHGETFTLRWIIWHVLEHEIHHRGELSLMLGMLGREGLDV